MNGILLQENAVNGWFEGRRDYFLRRLVEEFFRLTRSFRDVYIVYLDCRHPGGDACSDLMDAQAGEQRALIWSGLAGMVGSESSKGPLWKLKDLCHLLWPDREEQDVLGSLLDWLIGSIFHETMKLKENIYLLNRYGPAACRLKTKPLELKPSFGHGSAASPSLGSIIDVHGMINRASADAVAQMEHTAFLFNHALYMLRVMLPDLVGNMLVIRLLVEQEGLVANMWGEELEEIFQDLFYGDAAEGFCAAGRSYLGAQWFVQALKVYQRALAVNPTCDEAITRMVQLQAVVRDNRELLGAA